MSKNQRIRRSTEVEGNLVTISKPAFITMCKKPANQRGFSVLRSDGDEPATSKRVRPARARRSDTANLVRLEFPADLTEEQVKESLQSFGLGELQITRNEGEPWKAVNSAIACTDDELVAHKITEDGVTAFVKRSEAVSGTPGKNKIVVNAIRFDDKDASREEVEAWLAENGVDFDEKDLNNSSGKFVLQRAELEDGVETRQVELSEGVVAVISRGDSQDIPAGFVLVVNELAYSGYGWGQLDFNSYMADRTVGEAVRDAMYNLDSVINNILFWNTELTVEAKKTLVTRSVNQFAEYVNGFLDSLPRSLLIPVTPETISAQRSDTVKESKEMNMKSTPTAYVTKEDLASTVAEVLRSEREAERERERQAAAEKERLEQEAQIRRSETEEVVKAAVQPLLQQIEELKGTTVVRSGEEPITKPRKEEDVTRNDGSVFSGMLGDIHGLRDISELEDEADESGDE
ncbi:hypothetical protein FDG94_gp129 [Pseudomonas phage SM1]|uniref:Uncharacterized protein n=1 Tax=Pseudomonas phage SM1 TaxID=1772332 RepID=A0A0U2UUY5_9CAUD|nr:hypothetical protein FDG94_gp129 [Pseudomonas phage SM1]ALT58121.1 hypothetical protein SM1_0129 [Pseudomonas phage SM1]